MRWAKHGYGSLGALELSCIIIAIIVICFGFFALMTNIKLISLIFSILCFISAAFVLGVAIFCFIAIKTRYWKDYLGCNANYKGFLSIWNSVDTYLQLVDEYLCGPECICKFESDQITLYTTNSTTLPYFNLWYTNINTDKNNDISLRKNIDYCCDNNDNKECSNNQKNELYGDLNVIYDKRNAYFNHTFKIKEFHKYYKHIEKHFKCTGFCGITYLNTNTQTNQKIVKYLFSDLTTEIPQHYGCIGAIMDWLRKTIVAFGIIAVLLFVILMILFIIGLLYLCEADEDNRLNMPISTKGNEEGIPAMIIDNIDEKTGDSDYYKEKPSNDSEKNGIFETRKSNGNSIQRTGDEKHSINNKEKVSQIDNTEKKEEAKSTEHEIGNTSYVPTQEQKEETMFNFVPSDAL